MKARPDKAVMQMLAGVLAGMALLLFMLPAPEAVGEGSADMCSLHSNRPKGNRPYLEYRNDSFQRAGIIRRTTMKVYVADNESILLASSAQGIGSGRIRVTYPNGNTALSPAGNSAGYIANVTQETAGPNWPAGNVPTGFTPWRVVCPAGQAGVWHVEFISPDQTQQVMPTVLAANAAWAVQTSGQSYVTAWDVTARNAANTANIPGRVYSNHYALNMGNNGLSFNSITWVLTREGYVYHCDPTGLDPYAFSLYANNRGFLKADGSPAYQSIDYYDPTDLYRMPPSYVIWNPELPDTWANVTHKLFLNDPRTAGLPLAAVAPPGTADGTGQTWLLHDPPSVPVPQNFQFSGIESTQWNAGTWPLGGNFSFTSDRVCSYTITVDTNRDSAYGPLPDKILNGVALQGTNAVYWDGRDGNGAVVPAGNQPIQACVRLNTGELHFPILDPENHPVGYTLQRLNNPSPPPANAPNAWTVYWDDTGIPNGNQPGGQGTNPDPYGLDGANSQAGAHFWSANFGDMRGMDTWTYYPSEAVVLTTPIVLRQADLSVTKTHAPPIPSRGQTVTYTIVVSNAGPNNATGAQFLDTLPAQFTGVAWTSSVTGTGSSTPSSGSGNSMDCQVNLNMGSTLTYTVTATLSTVGVVTNTAKILRSLDTTDPDDPYRTGAGNNSATDAFAVGVDLEVTKTVSNSNPGSGANYSYTITVLNKGPATGLNLSLLDRLPSATTYQGTPYSASQGTYSTTRNVWRIGDLAPGASATLTLNVVNGNTATKTNTAEIGDFPWAASTSFSVGSIIEPPTANGWQYECVFTGTSGATAPSSWPTTAGATVNDSGTIWVAQRINVWQASTAYAANSWVSPVTANGHQYVCTVAGTTGASQPTWPTTPGTTVTNGTATFVCEGTVRARRIAYVLGNIVVSASGGNGYQYVCTTAGTSANNSGPTWPTTIGATVTDGTVVWTCQCYAWKASQSYTGADFAAPTTSNGCRYRCIKTGTSGGSQPTWPTTLAATVTDGGATWACEPYQQDVDSTPANNVAGEDDQASVTICGTNADLAIVKTANRTTLKVGDAVRFTLTLSNNGPGTPTTIRASDYLPTGLTFSSATPQSGDTFNSTTGTWTLGAAPPRTLLIDTVVTASPPFDTWRSSAAYAVNGWVVPPTCNGHVYRCTTAGTSGTTQPTWPATAGTTVTDGSVTWVCDGSTWAASTAYIQGRYSVPTTANGYQYYCVTAGTSGTAQPTWTTAIGNTVADGTATWVCERYVWLAVRSYTVGETTEPITANGCRYRCSFAGATGAAEPAWPTTGGVTVTDGSVTWTCERATWRASTSYVAGSYIEPATPNGFRYRALTGGTSGSAQPTWPTTLNRTVTDGTVTWVCERYQITNTATISFSDLRDSVTSNNTSSVSLEFDPSDLAVTKTVSSASPNTGDNVTYTITVTNYGPDPATGVQLRDLLPAGMTYVSSTPPGGDSYSSSTGLWTLSGTLAVGATRTLTIVATASTSGPHTNTASVYAADQFDPVTANNSASTVVTAKVPPDPTAVTLVYFTARGEPMGVLVEWYCASEFQNLGFNLWRRPKGAGEGAWTKVNSSLIAGRVSDPTPRTYQYFDWAPLGELEYRLADVNTNGVQTFCPQLAGPVTRKAFGLEWLPAFAAAGTQERIYTVTAALARDAATARAQDLAQAFSQAQATAQAAGWRDPFVPVNVTGVSANYTLYAMNTPWDDGLRYILSLLSGTPGEQAAALQALGQAWQDAARFSPASFTPYLAVKVTSRARGLLWVPQAAFPGDFDTSRLDILRGGQGVQALAQTPSGLLLWAPGYADDYTGVDAFMLRRGSVPTLVGRTPPGGNLFNLPQAPVKVHSRVEDLDFHDIYYQWDPALMPYSYPPWFSAKFLEGGSAWSFTLRSTQVAGGQAQLRVRVYSILGQHHALQVFVNGQPAGQGTWDGTGQMLELAFSLPVALLVEGNNTIELRTPAPSGADTRVLSFLHGLSLEYPQNLRTSGPLEVWIKNLPPPGLVEVTGLPVSQAWVADVTQNETARLIPCGTRRAADGTYTLRFLSGPHGEARFMITPPGMELAPLAASIRPVQPAPARLSYVATGPAQFAPAVQPLITARNAQGLPAAFLDQEGLFDAYGFGRYGPGGIRAAVQAVKPRYLLLVGHLKYDYRGYLDTQMDVQCPTVFAATSRFGQVNADAVYGDLGKGYPEVAVGRLPLRTPAEVTTAIGHILAYQAGASARLRGVLMADRTDVAADDFAGRADMAAAQAPAVDWTRIFLGATCATTGQARALLVGEVNNGADWVCYFGHSTASRLARETILTKSDLSGWNGNPMLLAAGCTLHYVGSSDPTYYSLPEKLLALSPGGIAGSLSTSTYMDSPTHGEFMGQVLVQAQKPQIRWGEALLKAQQWAFLKSQKPMDSYADLVKAEGLFGDPALFVRAPVAGAITPPIGLEVDMQW